jgi:hypothetical protein
MDRCTTRQCCQTNYCNINRCVSPDIESQLFNDNSASNNLSSLSTLAQRKLLHEFCVLLSDRLYALNQDKRVFQKFDTQRCGKLTQSQFVTCIALLGIDAANTLLGTRIWIDKRILHQRSQTAVLLLDTLSSLAEEAEY